MNHIENSSNAILIMLYRKKNKGSLLDELWTIRNSLLISSGRSQWYATLKWKACKPIHCIKDDHLCILRFSKLGDIIFFLISKQKLNREQPNVVWFGQFQQYGTKERERERADQYMGAKTKLAGQIWVAGEWRKKS